MYWRQNRQSGICNFISHGEILSRLGSRFWSCTCFFFQTQLLHLLPVSIRISSTLIHLFSLVCNCGKEEAESEFGSSPEERKSFFSQLSWRICSEKAATQTPQQRSIWTRKQSCSQPHSISCSTYISSGQVRSGCHPKGPSGRGCCSDVLPPSLSPTSSSSLTRFRPVVMPYNDKLALFRSFSILSIHRCFGRPTGRFPVGFQLWTMDGHLYLLILEICPYHFFLLFRTVFSAISCLVLTRTSALLTRSVYNAQYPTQPSIFACIQLILHGRCQAPSFAPV